MKLFKTIFLLIIAVTFITGCIKVETKVKINKDGSGRIFETVIMSKIFAEMISQFAGSFGDSTDTEKFQLFDEKDFIESAKDFGSGVQFTGGESVSEDGWEGFKAEYSFDDLNKIRLEPAPNNIVSIGMEDQQVEENKEYFYFKFIKGDIPEVIISRPEIEKDFNREKTEAEDNSDEVNDEFFKLMEGMRVDVSLEFEGEIVESNATHVEGSTVTLLSMDIGKIVKNKETLEILKNSQPEEIEDMEVYVEKIPGMKLELKKHVTVKFK